MNRTIRDAIHYGKTQLAFGWRLESAKFCVWLYHEKEVVLGWQGKTLLSYGGTTQAECDAANQFAKDARLRERFDFVNGKLEIRSGLEARKLRFGKLLIRNKVRDCGGNIELAADQLCVSVATIYRGLR